MRKILKVLVPLLAVLLLMSSLSVSVSAENVLILEQPKDVKLSGNESVPLTFTAPESGSYTFFCTAYTDEFSAVTVWANDVPLTADDYQPMLLHLEEGQLFVLSLYSDGVATVTVYVAMAGGTTTPTESTMPTESTTGLGEDTTTLPSESTTTTTTTLPSETTTTTTTVIPTAPTTTTIPTESTTTTAALPGVLFPTGDTMTTTTAAFGGGHPLATAIPSVGGDGSSGNRHVAAETELVIVYSIVALIIMVLGGVAIYIITKRQSHR